METARWGAVGLAVSVVAVASVVVAVSVNLAVSVPSVAFVEIAVSIESVVSKEVAGALMESGGSIIGGISVTSMAGKGMSGGAGECFALPMKGRLTFRLISPPRMLDGQGVS